MALAKAIAKARKKVRARAKDLANLPQPSLTYNYQSTSFFLPYQMASQHPYYSTAEFNSSATGAVLLSAKEAERTLMAIGSKALAINPWQS